MSGMLAKRSIASLAFAMAATAAFAHAQLRKAAVPGVGNTAAVSPTEIKLKFSEGLEPRFSEIALTTQAGAAEPFGPASVDPADDSVLIVRVREALKPGIYQVTWRALSVDLHWTQGNFAFIVAP